MHCFDFQWLKPYFPLVSEIEKVFETCKIINPLCHVKIYFFIHQNIIITLCLININL